MLQRQKAEIEEGLSELQRIYAQLSGKLGEVTASARLTAGAVRASDGTDKV